MPVLRPSSLRRTHHQLFQLAHTIRLPTTSLKKYAARFAIIHGCIVDQSKEALSILSNIQWIFDRTSVLHQDVIDVLNIDLQLFREQMEHELVLIALREIIQQFGTVLTTKISDDFRLQLLQLFLEQGYNSPLYEDSMEYWNTHYPQKSIFLITAIPSLWIPSPTVGFLSLQGMELLRWNDDLIIVGSNAIYVFRSSAQKVITILDGTSASDKESILKVLLQDGILLVCTTHQVFLLEWSNRRQKFLKSLLVEGTFLKMELYDDLWYLHGADRMYRLTKLLTVIPIEDSPPGSRDSFYSRKLPLLDVGVKDNWRLSHLFLLNPTTQKFTQLKYFADSKTKSHWIDSTCFYLFDLLLEEERIDLRVELRDGVWLLQKGDNVSDIKARNQTKTRTSPKKSTTYAWKDWIITILDYGQISLYHVPSDRTYTLETNTDSSIDAQLFGPNFAILSKRDVSILNLNRLHSLLSQSHTSLTLIYGGVKVTSDIFTITGTASLSSKFVLIWTYQGVMGQRTNIEYRIWDTSLEEEIYCENSQDLDEVDEVYIFDEFGDDDYPPLILVLGGHRAVFIELDDVPMLARYSHYEVEDLTPCELYVTPSRYTTVSKTHIHQFFDGKKYLGQHTQNIPSSLIHRTEFGDYVFCASASIFHVRLFSHSKFAQHCTNKDF